MNKRKIFLNEKTWEDYVAIRPEVFLGEDLELRSRQEIRNSGRFDLTFWDKDRRIVLVEIQLKALDRNHFFRMIEYHKDLRNQGYHDIRIILLCNELNPKRDYLDEYRDQLQLDIEVITIKRNIVEQTILDIDSPDGEYALTNNIKFPKMNALSLLNRNVLYLNYYVY